MADAEAVGVVRLAFDLPFLEEPVDIYSGLGSILEKGGEADVVMGCCGGSGVGGVHCFAELLIFLFDGCAVVKSEKIGWVIRWGGAVDWDKGEMFNGF